MTDVDRTHTASRYRLVLTLQCAGLAIFLTGFLLLVTLSVKAIGFATALVGILTLSAARQFRCPRCRKSMMVSYFGMKPSNPFRVIAFKNNFVPERVCSDCGMRLDGIAATGSGKEK